MTVVYSNGFRKNFHKLPASIQRIYRKQEAHFIENWHDQRLHTKKLITEQSMYSFRITRNYRVIFSFVEEETVLFTSIAHRKSAYQK